MRYACFLDASKAFDRVCHSKLSNILAERGVPMPYLNPRPAGVFSRTRPAGGGGGQILPPCLTPELIGAATRARRRSKALNEKIPMHIKKFSLRGHM